MTHNRRDAVPEARPGKEADDRQAGRAVLTAAQVAAYLRRHPHFLADHRELLDILVPPARNGMQSSGDGVLDLQHAMLERKRSESEALRQARDELLATTRGNLHAQSRVHAAVLALLAARSFEHLIEAATVDLAAALDLDAVTICVEQSRELPPPARSGVRCLPGGTVAALLGPSRAVLLRSDCWGDPLLFGPAAGLIRSDALLRLAVSSATPPALLVLGSRDPRHFAESQGTELLHFLAQVLESLLRAWLELPD